MPNMGSTSGSADQMGVVKHYPSFALLAFPLDDFAPLLSLILQLISEPVFLGFHPGLRTSGSQRMSNYPLQ